MTKERNSHISTSSQALEDSPLQQNGQDLRRSSFVKKKNSAKMSSKSIGQKFQSSPKSETSMEQNTEEQLSLPGVSPANLSPLPGSKEAKKMTVTSGRKCSGLLVKQNPVGYLQRMCLESSTWHSTRCLLTWKGKVTPQGRLLFQLVASTPRTEGTESGLLHTPDCSDRRSMKSNQQGLSNQIKMLPTPNSSDRYQANLKDGHDIKKGYLRGTIAMLPTPRAGCPGSRKQSNNEESIGLHSRENSLWQENWHEVATRFCRVDDGVSDRVHRLKALGNAIVPQIAFEIMKGMVKIEKEKR